MIKQKSVPVAPQICPTSRTPSSSSTTPPPASDDDDGNDGEADDDDDDDDHQTTLYLHMLETFMQGFVSYLESSLGARLLAVDTSGVRADQEEDHENNLVARSSSSSLHLDGYADGGIDDCKTNSLCGLFLVL